MRSHQKTGKLHQTVATHVLIHCLLSTAIHAAVLVFDVNLTPDAIVAETTSDDPNGSDASGIATFSLNTDDPLNPTLSYDITLTNLSFSSPRILTDPPTGDSTRYVRAIHIHFGAAGINGANHALNIYGVPAEHDANMSLILGAGATTTNRITGIWDNTDANNNGTMMIMDDTVRLSDAMSALENGDLYMQVHTLDYRQGELRGQLSPIPEPTTTLSSVFGLCALLICRRVRRK